MSFLFSALLSDDELIQTLTGESVRAREAAVLEGYDLVVQRLDQVPEIPQRIIRESWGDSFESYNLTPGEGHISGIKCKVTKDQWDRLDDWEFGEFGWFVPKEVEIKNVATGETEKVMTMVMGEGQSFDRKVDGDNFAPYIMPRDKTLEIAVKAKGIYDERNGLKSEGNISLGKEAKL
jgi:hypothetical protein